MIFDTALCRVKLCRAIHNTRPARIYTTVIVNCRVTSVPHTCDDVNMTDRPMQRRRVMNHRLYMAASDNHQKRDVRVYCIAY